MYTMPLQEVLRQLSNVIPDGYEERNSLLRPLGYKIFSITELQTFITMTYENNMLVFPWDIRITYVDPIWQVAKVSIYFEPIDLLLDWWMDLETIRDAGLQPVICAAGHQDMAWMCKEQSEAMYNSMFIPASGGRYSELEFHVQYFFDVIYGIKGYTNGDGKAYYLATDLAMADKWRDAICRSAEAKLSKVMSSSRYNAFVMDISRLESKKTITPIKEVSSTVLKLSSRL